MQELQVLTGLQNLLPNEAIIAAFKFLDFKSLCRIGITCKKLKEISSDNLLWKALCETNRVIVVIDMCDDFHGLSKHNSDGQKTELEEKQIDWKLQFAVHRRKVLEKMRKSRAYR
ncbi:hypothetical protein HK100_010075, partial [Physocladia obscura]